MSSPDPLLRWFNGDHLPPHLQKMMGAYADLGDRICQMLPPSAERTIALRELITSKDNAIRALVDLKKAEDAKS